ncbi:MAG: propanediol/glycerol family dehydratase large subunit [Acidimicrobiia bacterium]
MSDREEARKQRGLRDEMVIEPQPSLGLVTMDGPNDPAPSLTITHSKVMEMDGKRADTFDLIDRFIGLHGIDVAIAEHAMGLDDVEIATRLVDVAVPRNDLVALSGGLTPAKLARVVTHLDPVEMMFALKKLRARRRPANQAHVTNRKENPALLAADAAEAAVRGFAEIETTVGVARYAPFNAIALLVGSQAGRPGVLTQCAVEERRNLQLGMQGLTTYSETLSVYGTDGAMVDGDDTPWSKAFLASAYASRGIKVRFTSGSGSEALMGHAEGRSMLYLEARCLAMIRAAGSQGVQNGGISTVTLPLALPGGTKMILAENLIAAWLGLEVASGNDAIASHSPIRRTAKLMGQFLPGTDFVTSGYSAVPKYDNMFGGGNYDTDDLDEWTTIQRDWQVDAGIEPVGDAAVLAVRQNAANAIQAVFREIGFPEITDEEVKHAVVGYDSRDVPDRDRAADVEAADLVFAEELTGIDVARALDAAGFDDIARAVLGMQRLRVSADYLQTSAIVDADWHVESAVNEPNEYTGPGTGYRLEGDRWAKLQTLPHMYDPASDTAGTRADSPPINVLGEAEEGTDPDEVIVGVGPAFLGDLRETIGGIDHVAVLGAIISGIGSQGASVRLIRVRRTSDVAFIAHDAALLSGSGISIGIQSKGTAVIHGADQEPLDNLELFSMAPLLTIASYEAIGANAAAYALSKRTSPVPVEIDNFARAKHIVRTTLLHATETAAVEDGAPADEFQLEGPG